MFQKSKAFSGFSVNDIAAAKQFYGDTLGLDVTEMEGMLQLHAGRWRQWCSSIRSRTMYRPRTRCSTFRSTTSSERSMS